MARDLDGLPAVGEALGAGRLSSEQAGVICHGVSLLPDEMGASVRDRVVEQLVGLAGEFGPPALRGLVAHAVEVVAPEIAEDADRRVVVR